METFGDDLDGSGADNGGAPTRAYQGGPGGGLLGNLSGGYANEGGRSFINGGLGGYAKDNKGGFGGGGSSMNNQGGGAGGYSGGTVGGGGGGSLNTDINGTIISGFNKGHGLVVITKLVGTPMNHQSSHFKSTLVLGSQVKGRGKKFLLDALGSGYRLATPEEVTKAKEAATPGSVNRWSASRPIQPRNLPAKVNEYGFDSNNYNSRAWWVVKE